MKNYNKVCFLTIISLFCILCIECNSKTELDNFFSQVDMVLSKEEKAKLIKCDSVNCIVEFVFANSNEDLKNLFNNLPNKIASSLDSLEIIKYRELSVLVAYNKKSNGEVFSFSEIKEEIKKYFQVEQQNLNLQTLKRIERLTSIAEVNYKKMDISDTICLTFPLEYIDGVHEAVYRFPREKDSLIEMSCIVSNKEFIPKPQEYEFSRDQYVLTLKVIELSEAPCLFMSEEIILGNQISVDIFDYGRDIKLERKDSKD